MPKPRKVEEPAGTYRAPTEPRRTNSAAKKKSNTGETPTYIAPNEAERISRRLLSERKDLLHKLAQ